MSTYAPPFQVCVPWTQPFATVGSWTRVQASVYLGGGVYVSDPNINNSVSYRVALGAGTNTVTIIGNVADYCGISTVTLDGVSLGTLDWYGASLVQNAVKTITGITVATAGVYTLTLTAATKHASASAYYQALGLISVHRSDDASGPIVGATLPHRVDIIPWAGTKYAGDGGGSITQSSIYLGGGRFAFNNLNQYNEWLVPLAAGTWKFTHIWQSGTSNGIATFALGGTSFMVEDQYAAVSITGMVSTTTGIVVAQDGIYKLRVTTTGKNASSAGYALVENLFILQRTGT